MITKRIIPCLDVRNGRVVKGTNFQGLQDVSSPVELGKFYSDNGADELVFYDITASAERRPIDIGMVEAVAKAIRIPFAVGGGISSVEDMERVILAGAEKISVNSLAVRNPDIIADGAKAFGAQCIVLGMDPVKSGKTASGYEITTRGFREFTGMDAVEWAKRAVDLGAGEIVVNSVDADGTREGNVGAAKEAFATLGRIAGAAISTAVTIIDGLVVIGGGVSAASRWIMPALLEEMRSKLHTLTGDEVSLVNRGQKI